MEDNGDLDGGLVSAYRKAMKKYHPDVTELDLDFALEMSKLVNEAYAFLASNIGKWSINDKGESNVAAWMVDVYNRIRHIPNITIIRAGVWLWVKIERPEEFRYMESDDVHTIAKKSQGFKAHKKAVGAILEEAGFVKNHSKDMHSWHCVDQGPRKRWKRGAWSWDRIIQTFTTDELETNPYSAVA
jgi:hypothetical protein